MVATIEIVSHQMNSCIPLHQYVYSFSNNNNLHIITVVSIKFSNTFHVNDTASLQIPFFFFFIPELDLIPALPSLAFIQQPFFPVLT